MSERGNELFKNYTTKTAFNLTLSHNQCRALSNLSLMTDQDNDRFLFENMNTIYSLARKGLLTMTGEYASEKMNAFPKCELTDAGLALIPLLKLSGLYEPDKIYEKLYPVELPEPKIGVEQ